MTKKERLELLEECARYVFEFESDDWEDQLWENSLADPNQHVWSKAYRALHGEKEFKKYLNDYIERHGI